VYKMSFLESTASDLVNDVVAPSICTRKPGRVAASAESAARITAVPRKDFISLRIIKNDLCQPQESATLAETILVTSL